MHFTQKHKTTEFENVHFIFINVIRINSFRFRLAGYCCFQNSASKFIWQVFFTCNERFANDFILMIFHLPRITTERLYEGKWHGKWIKKMNNTQRKTESFNTNLRIIKDFFILFVHFYVRWLYLLLFWFLFLFFCSMQAHVRVSCRTNYKLYFILWIFFSDFYRCSFVEIHTYRL